MWRQRCHYVARGGAACYVVCSVREVQPLFGRHAMPFRDSETIHYYHATELTVQSREEKEMINMMSHGGAQREVSPLPAQFTPGPPLAVCPPARQVQL